MWIKTPVLFHLSDSQWGRLISAPRGQRLIESSAAPAVFIGPDRCRWSRGLTHTSRGWRQTLKWQRWEAALHKSICASDSSSPGGPDNCRAARQLPGFAAKNLWMDDVGGISSSVTNTFNPSSAGEQPRGPQDQTGVEAERCRGPSGPRAPVLDIIFNRSGLI